MQGNFSLQCSDMALVSRPAHKITMGEHFKTDVMRAVSIKAGQLPRQMFFNTVYFNMWCGLLCLLQVFCLHDGLLPSQPLCWIFNSAFLIYELHMCAPDLWKTTIRRQVFFPLCCNLTPLTLSHLNSRAACRLDASSLSLRSSAL